MSHIPSLCVMPAIHPVSDSDQLWPCPLNVVKRRPQAVAEAGRENDWSACRRHTSDSSASGDQTLTVVKRRKGSENKVFSLAVRSPQLDIAASNKLDQDFGSFTTTIRPALSTIPNGHDGKGPRRKGLDVSPPSTKSWLKAKDKHAAPKEKFPTRPLHGIRSKQPSA